MIDKTANDITESITKGIVLTIRENLKRDLLSAPADKHQALFEAYRQAIVTTIRGSRPDFASTVVRGLVISIADELGVGCVFDRRSVVHWFQQYQQANPYPH